MPTSIRPEAADDGVAHGAAVGVPAEPIALAGKRVVLLLQGGGALGGYQVGVHRVLAAECERVGARIDWVGGISIGAVNAAVIAGPKAIPGVAASPATLAVRRLDALWDDILSRRLFPWQDCTPEWRLVLRALSPVSRWLPAFPLAPLAAKWWNWAWMAARGQRHFFDSRALNPSKNPWIQQWLRPLRREELAFYGTEKLAETLKRHVDFEAINAPWTLEKPRPRLSLGAARVTTGDVVFFESDGKHRRRLSAAHVLASGALPPAFPPIRIKDPVVDDLVAEQDAVYWDGGVSTNTPIEWLVGDVLPKHDDAPTIVFLVDVWDRKGPLPTSMDEVCWRQKSIQYGSRKDAAARAVREQQLRHLARQATLQHRLEVYQVMYERSDADGPQFGFADADFSRATFEQMVRHGEEDMRAALRSPVEVQVDPGFSHPGAVLYRHGTHGKHRRPPPAPQPVASPSGARARAAEPPPHVS
jgi:NTE family protein